MLILSKVYISSYSMKKEEKRSSTSRWNDCSTMSIIHTPTEEERKKAIDEMVDNAVRNIEKFYADKNKQNIKDLKLSLIHI